MTVTLTPTDEGSGWASTSYCIYNSGDSACTPSTSGTSATTTCTAGNVCQQYVRYRSVDNVSNTESIKTSALIRVDMQAPTVTINQQEGQDDPTGTMPIKFDVVFSDVDINADTFLPADIKQNGTATDITWTLSDLDATHHLTWELRATAALSGGTIEPSIDADMVEDGVGNKNTASTSEDNTVAYAFGHHAPAPPYVALRQPMGGQTLAAGDSYQIVWQSGGEGISSARLKLSTDGGETYPTTIADDLVSSIYSWTVPVVATEQARIKVEAILSGGAVGASDASLSDFTITAPAGSPSHLEEQHHGGGGGGGGGGGITTPSGVGGSTFSGSLPRQEADNQLPPNYPVDSLVKLPTDHNPATTADETVYYLGLDAKRHPFPSRAIFLSWYDNFSQVLDIDAATLASIPLGNPIMVRPGTHWVKIISDPRTYFVEPGNKLRWIQDEAAAVLLGGADWNTNIIDIDPSLFISFVIGADLTAAGVAGGDWPAGSLVKTTDVGASTYYVTAAAIRPFTGTGFEDNKFQNRFIETTAPGFGWTSKPAGMPISVFESDLFSLMH